MRSLESWRSKEGNNPRGRDEDTLALRALNTKIHGDARVDISLVPIADGLALARKR